MVPENTTARPPRMKTRCAGPWSTKTTMWCQMLHAEPYNARSLCLDMCIDMGTDMCLDMCIGMCTDLYVDIGTDMCIGMGTDMCIDIEPYKATSVRFHR